MEFLVEIVVTAFALGGVLGAIIALHLSANLKSSESQVTAAEKTTSKHAAELQHARINTHPKQTEHSKHRRH